MNGNIPLVKHDYPTMSMPFSIPEATDHSFHVGPPMRQLDTDAIKTLDDVKAVLRAMQLAFSGDAAKSIEHLLTAPKRYSYYGVPYGGTQVQDCTNLPNWGESQGSKGHAGMPC